ncbi:hypothetical protein RND71_020124 [Anisodus tanguticus]|uniref:KH type-2 domain-containing protein n=1 Tax=Anisodus tanguticus TaxID=243964 RepID=A0AAE1S1U3_9SOLA|nr:hypothetical protein RND71_020124 [Anisodus tanguticus]
MRALCLNVSLFTATLPKNYTCLIHSSSPSFPADNGGFRLRATTTRRRSELEENNKFSSIAEEASRTMRIRRSKDVVEEEDSSMLLSLSVKPDRNMSLLDDYEMEELDLVPHNPNHRSGLPFLLSLLSDYDLKLEKFKEKVCVNVGYVAVLGKPNVGKSTLSNQMVGQKLSIVTDKPQTTRHRVLSIFCGPEHQIILYDTPGVIEKKMHKLDSMMMKNVRSAAVNADCVLVVVDACKVPGKWYEKFTDADEVIPVSAKYGHGVEDVKDWILSKLPLGPAYYPKDIASEHPERFFVAEIVREKIFLQYRNEVPYACQVNVVSYKTRPNAKDFIQVEVIVEKNTQKIILIGKEGKALKLLATAARLDIEDFLQKKVFLEIEVKVKENWRQNEGLLKDYGYGGQIKAL